MPPQPIRPMRMPSPTLGLGFSGSGVLAGAAGLAGSWAWAYQGRAPAAPKAAADLRKSRRERREEGWFMGWDSAECGAERQRVARGSVKAILREGEPPGEPRVPRRGTGNREAVV